jgi:hypothetical protein
MMPNIAINNIELVTFHPLTNIKLVTILNVIRAVGNIVTTHTRLVIFN